MGPIGCEKSTTVKWIMNKLDIIPLKDDCPCIYDPTRRLYLLGRYKHCHGPSKINLGDETDRIVPDIETIQLKQLLKKLYKKSNIVICDGISQLVFNVPMLTFAMKAGYPIKICELSTDRVTRREQLLARGDPWRKTLFLDDRYKHRKK